MHDRAKGVIHVNETATKGDVPEDVTEDRKPKKVVHGIASWYGKYFDGKMMKNGEPFSMRKVSVAHRSLPLGTKVRVTNIENGKYVLATVTDRGPFTKKDGVYSRELDLSEEAARRIDPFYKEKGLLPVRIEVFI